MKLSPLLTLASGLLVLANPLGFKHADEYARIGEHTYHYLRTEPEAEYKGTIFLVHGFPDMPHGWHNQIPHLAALGWRVFAPSALGYPRTSSPDGEEPFALSAMASDLAGLIRHVTPAGEQIVLAGHDWGCALVWRTVVLYPELMRGVIGMAVPHGPPAEEYVDLADQIEHGQMLNWGYQLQLRDPATEDLLRGPDNIRQFLRATFEGKTPDGRAGINAADGVDFDALPLVQPAPYLPAEMEAFYTSELTSGCRDTLAGPLKYYRTARANWEDDKAVADGGGSFFIDVPALFICGEVDQFVPCSMSRGMEGLFADLTRRELDSGHWLQIQKADEVNALFEQWLGRKF
ncbi:hypothetical protein N3K66_004294 [Trichothecium roseum]|uniref:Uncharacterized protein n=1 Tax=Trichothecium roseum TaxID=47278 RepID=A0ACC0V176_9HYPO|nr:hypothetical protein N3K66_004294 [Trichothecium roseum]